MQPLAAILLKATTVGIGSFVAAVAFVYAKEAVEAWWSACRFRRENLGARVGHRMSKRQQRINDAAAAGRRDIRRAYGRALSRMERAR